jgi:hypothetical protein
MTCPSRDIWQCASRKPPSIRHCKHQSARHSKGRDQAAILLGEKRRSRHQQNIGRGPVASTAEAEGNSVARPAAITKILPIRNFLGRSRRHRLGPLPKSFQTGSHGRGRIRRDGPSTFPPSPARAINGRTKQPRCSRAINGSRPKGGREWDFLPGIARAELVTFGSCRRMVDSPSAEGGVTARRAVATVC